MTLLQASNERKQIEIVLAAVKLSKIIKWIKLLFAACLCHDSICCLNDFFFCVLRFIYSLAMHSRVCWNTILKISLKKC